MDLEIELARASFVIGLIATAFVYHRLRMVTGGTITASYISYLISIGLFEDVLGWLVLSFAGYFAITLISNHYPIPRRWLFYSGIIAVALIHATASYIADLSIFSNLSGFITAGMYVTSGLTAYDFKRQGILKTLGVFSVILVVALAIILPMRAFITSLGGMESPETFTETEPIVVVVAVISSALVTLALGLGSAGIIGALFFFQILSLETLIFISIITIVGAEIYKLGARFFLLTPRQEIQAVLTVGGVASWIGLFWTQQLGITSPGIPHDYSLEPIIITGLMILETLRVGYIRSISGTTLVLGAIGLTSYLVTLDGIVPMIAIGGLLLALLLTFVLGLDKVQRDIDYSIEISRHYPIHTHSNNVRIMRRHPHPEQFG